MWILESSYFGGIAQWDFMSISSAMRGTF